MEQETRRRGRAGGRGARQAADSKSATRSLAYRQLRHPYEPQSIFGADEINSIHKTALRVLEELGMKILLPEAREIFAKAGAKVVDEMVFIGSDIMSCFTDRFVGAHGGFFGTGFNISTVENFTDNGLIATGCRREAFHRSHRCSRHQPRRADQR